MEPQRPISVPKRGKFQYSEILEEKDRRCVEVCSIIHGHVSTDFRSGNLEPEHPEISTPQLNRLHHCHYDP